MTKANGKCNRCAGTGMRDTPVAHLGVPGLCYDCNGSGRYEDQAAAKAYRAAVKAAEDRRRAATDPVYEKIWDVRRRAKELGYPSADREQRAWFRAAGVFGTDTFAEAFGIDRRAAWNILCCSYPKVGLFYDEAAGTVRGWSADYNA